MASSGLCRLLHMDYRSRLENWPTWATQLDRINHDWFDMTNKMNIRSSPKVSKSQYNNLPPLRPLSSSQLSLSAQELHAVRQSMEELARVVSPRPLHVRAFQTDKSEDECDGGRKSTKTPTKKLKHSAVSNDGTVDGSSIRLAPPLCASLSDFVSPSKYMRSLTLSETSQPSSAIPKMSNSLRVIELSQCEYKMTHARRGLCVIINNDTFQPHLQLQARSGSRVDEQNMLRAFVALGFECRVYRNLTAEQMLLVLHQVSQMDHSNCDCFVGALFSHGDSQNLIYGVDGPVPLQQLFTFFQGHFCPSLTGKPKLFFIQACRGKQLDDGVLATDGRKESEEEKDASRAGDAACLVHLPSEADYLVSYAVSEGYYAWRNTELGSWYVQALSQTLQHCAQSPGLEIHQLLTVVNAMVAEMRSKAAPVAAAGQNVALISMSGRKQMPSFVSQLRKLLYLAPKTLS